MSKNRSILVVKQKLLVILFIAIAICSFQCNLSDPENYLDFDREKTKPSNIDYKPLDAFTIQIEWTINSENIDKITAFNIYRADTSDTSTNVSFSDDDYKLIEVSIDLISTVVDTFYYKDSKVFYKHQYSYYIFSTYEGKPSFSSDTLVPFVFEMPPPEVIIDISSADSIKQNYYANSNNASGVEIIRIENDATIPDTIKQIINYPDTGEKKIITYDYLAFNYDSPQADYTGRQLYEYQDIKPNVSYEYIARDVYIKGQDTLFSISAEPIKGELRRNIPFFSTRAYSDSIIRLYISDDDYSQFHSVRLYIQNGAQWDFFDSNVLDASLIHYNNSILWDVPYYEPYQDDAARIVLIGDNSYSIPDNVATLHHLELPGFVLIEGGIFMLGCIEGDTECDSDEEPSTDSTTIPSFYLSKYEVTQNDYNDYSWTFTKGTLPVDNISWITCSTFIDSMSDNSNGYTFRLPSEAQWEYAAKHYLKGNDFKYPWGDDIDIYDANYGNSNTGLVGVGQYPTPSRFGIYDMAGNVLEWVHDEYKDSLGVRTVWRVARGGAYWHGSDDVRTTKRFHYPEDASFDGIGFRVVLEVVE